ncbi:MAG: DUF411 domain-containing protein [Gammaproteobacteria bacterium]
MKRLTLFLISGLFLASSALRAENTERVDITVYRSPSCGCCGKWIEHLEKNNFKVEDILTEDMQAIKDKYGVPSEMASCHTALVNGYVIEGHVPASDIDELLKNKPKVAGIAVPGMVTGSPGMEMGSRKDPYDVMSFDRESHFQIFKSYSGK